MRHRPIPLSSRRPMVATAGIAALVVASVLPAAAAEAPADRARGGWTVVAAAEDFTCAVRGGDAWCWGLGNHGQLGSATGSAARPTGTDPVSGTVRQVTAGGWNGCLLTSAGTAWCWGINSFGEAGVGHARELSVPTPVATSGALAGVRLVRVTSGFHHTCALSDDGRAFCWGQGAGGQLGTGQTTDASRPQRVDTSGALRATRLVALDAGDFSTCGIDLEGRALCWGTLAGFASTPTPVPSGGAAPTAPGFRAVTVGGDGSMDLACALDGAGTAWCWGTGLSGQLGDGSRTSRPEPAPVTGTMRFTDVSAGGRHACGIDTRGQAWCWGANDFGQLGTGNRRDALKPVPVTTSGVLDGVRLESISAGYRHTCATSRSGKAFCWGAGTNGELGNGQRRTSTVPTPVR